MAAGALLAWVLAWVLAWAAPAAEEFRGLWVDTFHAGLRTSNEVSQLVADARAGHFNAVIVEARKRGDAYYNSRYEPKAADVSPPDYDPLADLVAKAHTGSPRLEVHAWITTYLVWGNQTNPPASPIHPYNRHPDWLSRNQAGQTWDGSNYQFDPAHPEVQRHVFNVAMDIVSRYDVDGFHFDYVRYSGNAWGYNQTALDRFRARYRRTDQPGPTDAQWLQFRRDQVSGLVRKVYLSATALKPLLKVSAATICWSPGPANESDWLATAAWSSVLQDWRGWLEEGILDMAIPMAYFDQGGPYLGAWQTWNEYARNHRYSRHVVIGPGLYKNSLSNAIVQMRFTRQPSAAGRRADGLAGYSYAVPTSDNTPRATFLAALTQTDVSRLFDPSPEPIFPCPTNPPAMIWKTAPSRGHLKGAIIAAENGDALDGALVLIGGPSARGLTNDATGFYGFVDLPPGDYTVTASFSNRIARSDRIRVSVGAVESLDLALPAAEPATIGGVMAAPGRVAALISWRTLVPASACVEYGNTTNLGSLSPVQAAAGTNPIVFLGGLQPGTEYFFRAISRSATNESVSDILRFRTAGETVVDNPAAVLSGPWTTGSTAADRYGADYAYAMAAAVNATAEAVFTPVIATPGNYDVYAWHSQGANRTTNAPFFIQHEGGSASVFVDQTTGGGAWRLLAAGRRFARGSSGYVRLRNDTGETGKVVIADAVAFVYSAGQDPPPSGSAPDWWAQVFFGAPASPAADPDGDGFDNAAEYWFGTRPDDAFSRVIFRAESQAGALRCGFDPYVPGRTYRLQRKAGLGSGSWETWSSLAPFAVPGGGGAFLVTNPPAGPVYYRLLVQPGT